MRAEDMWAEQRGECARRNERARPRKGRARGRCALIDDAVVSGSRHVLLVGGQGQEVLVLLVQGHSLEQVERVVEAVAIEALDLGDLLVEEPAGATRS